MRVKLTLSLFLDNLLTYKFDFIFFQFFALLFHISSSSDDDNRVKEGYWKLGFLSVFCLTIGVFSVGICDLEKSANSIGNS